MKNYAYEFIYVLILFLIHTAALNVFTGASIWFPQLLLLWVIALALNHSLSEIVWFSFAAGILAELFSGLFFGTWIVALSVTGLIVYWVTRKLTAQDLSVPTVIFLVALGTLLFPFWGFLYNWLGSLAQVGEFTGFGSFYSATVLWTVLSNLALFYPVNFVFKFINQRFRI